MREPIVFQRAAIVRSALARSIALSFEKLKDWRRIATATTGALTHSYASGEDRRRAYPVAMSTVLGQAFDGETR